MAFRDQWRNAVVTEVQAESRSGAGTTRYAFVTGKPEQTDIVVQRGLVRHPETLEIIPRESASSPHFVFTDPRVDRLYGQDFVAGLRGQGYQIHTVMLPEGEAAKTLANYERCVDEVLSQGIDERSVLISLGGGVVCNVCGFIASTLYRGIGLVHVPTTLMAQCDAAISHKQAVNGSKGKNMVGSYYAPKRIFVDVDTLASLDARLIPDGLAEVVKHALGQDPAFIRTLQAYRGDHRDPDFLETVVRRNIELKCQLMANDPKEHREGMVLQYGHTVGHPIEFLSSFRLSHGQAVAIGMMIAVRVARLLGGCADSDILLHRDLIEQFGLPSCIPREIAPDDIMEMMRYNKRYLTEGTRMALVSGPGQLWSVDDNFAIPVPDEVVRAAIMSSYGEAP
jgi:3-dehydroquinate synthase